jgi:cyclopropane fatty-acyl-phospholipid synthase-like methyltransferase
MDGPATPMRQPPAAGTAAPDAAAPQGPARAESEAALRRYYDASTRRFLALGGSGASLAIHRGLWAPGISTGEAAADHINRLIVRRLKALDAPVPGRILDLGCGVGGTLIHLARTWPEARLDGITLSPRQATLAEGFLRARGLEGRAKVVCDDFLSLRPLPPADLVIAIESHVHAPSAGAFLAAASAALAPGGYLVIVDDMLARPLARMTARERRLVATFIRGWHLGQLPEPEALHRAARAGGLTVRADDDLSHFLRLDRLRDRMLHLSAPVADALGLGRWPLFSNMIGGNALTLAHRRGLLRYRMMVFRAAADAQGRA